jgi:ATP-binding cassette, subfamily C, bacterial
MKKILFILRTFGLLKEHQPRKLALIFTLTLINGITAGFSIVLLIPLLQLLDLGVGDSSDELALFFRNAAEKAGIELNLLTVLLVYLFLLTLTPLLQYWKGLLDSSYQQTFIYNLRRRLFRKIILTDWSVLNRKSKTSHLQVLTKEIPNMADYYYFYMRMLTGMLITASYTAWALLISVKFTAVIMAVGLLLFVFLRRFLFKAFHLGEDFITSFSQLLKYIDDFWQTVKIAKVHSSEDFYYDKFDEASTSLLSLEYKMQKNRSLPQLIYRITGIAILVAAVYIGYSTGNVPLTSFFILILLFSRIFPQFVSFNGNVSSIIGLMPSVQMVLKLDEELPDAQFHRPEEVNPLPVEKGITLSNIHFAYPGGEEIFSNFSESIPARKITGIIGESGRGKTTLIDLIAGLQKPGAGGICVDDRPLGEELLPSWRRSIGYLPQDAFFLDGSLRDNLVWDSRQVISDDRIWEVLGQVNAVHLATRFKKGLDEPVVNYAYNFSGGERQRLALARVLLRKPVLLLLDEATSSLDPENERQVMEVISGLRKQVTILFVTHRASLLPWFDKIIRLNGQT